MRELIISGGDAQNALVEIALTAGADANVKDESNQKAAIFSPNIPRSRLELLGAPRCQSARVR